MMATEFVTAEDVQSPRSGVWVQLTTISTVIDGQARPVRFEIITSTGYRATLPACLCDRTPCLRDCGSRRHCHYGVHAQTAQSVAGKVAATYGSAETGGSSPAGLRSHPVKVRSIGVKAWERNPYAMALEGRT